MTLVTQLSSLESAGLIRLAAIRPELEYLFRHALVRDAAYESLLRQDRRQLHGAVGEALERLYPERRDELAATLAYHFERAGAADKALHYFMRAGDRARATYANAEAIAYYRAALDQLEGGTRTNALDGDGSDLTVRLHESLGDVLALTGEHDQATARYRDARAALPASDVVGWSRLYRKTADALTNARRHEEALQTFSMAETVLGDEPAELSPTWWQEWVEVQLDLMWLLYMRASLTEMAEVAERAKPAVESWGTPAQRGVFYMRLVLLAHRRERYLPSAQTIADAEASLVSIRESDALGQIAFTQFALGFTYLWSGALDSAEAEMQAALELAERTGDIVLQSRILTYLAVGFRKRGRVEQVRDAVVRCLAISTTGHMDEYIATATANLAWVAWRQGDVAQAREGAQAALELWNRNPIVYPFRWTALWPLLAMALEEDQIAEALEHARALLEPAQQRLPDTLTALLDDAIRAWQRARPEIAAAHLRRAVQLAQEQGSL
jgi:tetratricopeptide (TPR) repeat protein